MFNKIKSCIEEFLNQFLIISLIVLFVFGIFIFFDRPFIIANDQQLQYNLFYEEWLRLIRNFLSTGELPFYSWYKFLGSDFYSSASIYVTGDYLIPFLLLFKNIESALMFESIILIYISSITFHIFLKSFGIENHKIRVLVSIIYSFTGLAILYFGNYMFHRFYAILPLMFAGVEYYLVRKKSGLFIFSTFLLFITSIYFMFPTSIFLIIYYSFSYFNKFQKFFTVDYFKKAFLLIYYYILGFLLSAFVTVPSILFLFSNPRIGENNNFTMFWEIKVLIGFFMSHISAPYPIFTVDPYLFASGTNGHATWYSVYATSITSIVLISYFLFIKDKNKGNFLFLYLLALLTILIKPLNSIFHGLSEPSFRFVFLYINVTLLIVAYTLDRNLKIPSIRPFLTILLAFSISIILLFTFNILDYSVFYKHINFLIVSLISCAAFALLWHFTCFKIASMYIFIEIIVFSTFVIYNLNLPIYKYTPSLTIEYVEYYESIDSDIFYRIYIDPKHLLPTSELNLNQSIYYSYKSTSTYDTGYETQLSDFLKLNGINWHIIHIKDPDILRLLGVKYFIVYDESELPLEYEFEYVYDLDFLKVYEFKNYRSIGFTFNQFRILEEIENSSQVDWNSTLLIYKDDMIKIKNLPISNDSNEFNVFSITTNIITGEIETNIDTILFLSIPYNEGWKVIVDGVESNYFKVNGGFIGIELDKGYHTIEMHFMPKGFKSGIFLACLGLILLLTNFIVVKLKFGKLTS